MGKATRSILFACNMNSVRSPIAEALARRLLGPGTRVESCGVYEGMLDPFVAEVLLENDLPIPQRPPQTFADVHLAEFDRVIALSPEAAAEARRLSGNVSYWEIDNPTDIRGGDEELRRAYRLCRDCLAERINSEFQSTPAISPAS